MNFEARLHPANYWLAGAILVVATLLALYAARPPVAQVRAKIGGVYTGDLNEARVNHSATALTNGSVLVVGGISGGGQASAELYDPSTGVWTPTGSLDVGRGGHTSTPLSDGTILVVGGYSGTRPLDSAELYDPATETWRTTGSLNTARDEHSATLLSDGRVLVVGGYSNRDVALNTAELYTPATGTWTELAAQMQTARYDHTASVIDGGKVLVVGGLTDAPGGGETTTNTAEVYDPIANAWSSVGNLTTARYAHTATVLENGNVFVAGGRNGTPWLASTEQFDPTTNTWTAMSSLSIPRSGHTATLVSGNALLLVGGLDGTGRLDTNELYDPGADSWVQVPNLEVARNGHTATPLTGNLILVAGGSGSNGASLASVELYDPGVEIVPEPVPESTLVPKTPVPVATPRINPDSPTIYLPVIQNN